MLYNLHMYSLALYDSIVPSLSHDKVASSLSAAMAARFPALSAVVAEAGERYGRWQSQECSEHLGETWGETMSGNGRRNRWVGWWFGIYIYIILYTHIYIYMKLYEFYFSILAGGWWWIEGGVFTPRYNQVNDERWYTNLVGADWNMHSMFSISGMSWSQLPVFQRDYEQTSMGKTVWMAIKEWVSLKNWCIWGNKSSYSHGHIMNWETERKNTR